MPEHAPDQAVVEQAIQWLIQMRFSQPQPETLRAFDAWLNSQPQHRLAWRRVQSMSDEFSQLPDGMWERTNEHIRRQRIGRRQALKALLACGVTVGAGWLGVRQFPELVADQRTRTGERRTFSLPGGGLVQLNSHSAVDVSDHEGLQQVWLREGDIILSTPPGRAQRLRVETSRGYVLTDGADLLVSERTGGTLISVGRGQAELFSRKGFARSLAKGDSLVLGNEGQTQASRADIDHWAWSEGVLSVKRMPLRDFLGELNRYRPGFIQCADEVAGLQVSGTYQLADTDEILALLGQTLAIRIEYRTRYWVLVGQQGAAIRV